MCILHRCPRSYLNQVLSWYSWLHCSTPTYRAWRQAYTVHRTTHVPPLALADNSAQSQVKWELQCVLMMCTTYQTWSSVEVYWQWMAGLTSFHYYSAEYRSMQGKHGLNQFCVGDYTYRHTASATQALQFGDRCQRLLERHPHWAITQTWSTAGWEH